MLRRPGVPAKNLGDCLAFFASKLEERHRLLPQTWNNQII